jgi:hypothetical protein
MGLADAEQFAPLAAITATLADVTITQNVATAMSAAQSRADRGVVVQAAPGNTATIRVGGSDADNTHGVLLVPGGCVFIGVHDAAAIYCWSSAAGQKAGGLVL